MAGPGVSAAPHGEHCPRCGAALQFEDEDGTRECVCGWSERAWAEDDAGPAPEGAADQDPMLL